MNSEKTKLTETLRNFGFPFDIIQGLTEQQSAEEYLQDLCDYAYASKKYYTEAFAHISDSEFDALSEKIEKEQPKVFAWLQSVIFDKDKFVRKTEKNGPDFTQEMISLFKIKENNRPAICISEVRRFLCPNNQAKQLYIAPKLDGCSLKVTYESTPDKYGYYQISSIITRGGIDVTELVKIVVNRYTHNVCPINHKTFTITGELVIEKEVFARKYSSEVGGDYENPRNFVAGCLKRKELDSEVLSDLAFVPCTDGINPITKNSVRLYKDDMYIDNKPTFITVNLQTQSLSELYKSYKSDDFMYLCDGIVIGYIEEDGIRKVKDNYPLNMVAVKFPAPTAHAEVIDIEWSQKKSGKLTPKLILKPTRLDGSTIGACAGYNYEYLKSKRIGIGSLVEIEKSGDIIPVVRKVVRASKELKLPNVDYKISGKHLIAINNEESKRFKFKQALKLLQLPNIGDVNSEIIGNVVDYDIFKCFDPAFTPHIATALSGSNAVFAGFKEIYNIKNIHLNLLLELMQFNDVGPKTAFKLAQLITRQSTDTTNVSANALDVIRSKDTMAYVNNIIKSLAKLGIRVLPPVQTSEDSLTYEMSGNPPGMTKQEFEKRLKQLYPNAVHTTLSKTTNILFVNMLSSATSKALKARKYNIRIVTYSDVLNGKEKL